MAVNDTIFFQGDSKVAIDNPRSYHDILCANLGKIDRYWGTFGRTMQSLQSNSPANNSMQYIVDNNITSTLDAPIDGVYVYNERIFKYIVCFGTNDTVQPYNEINTVDNFKVQYRKYIDKLVEVGQLKEKIIMLTCDVIDFNKVSGTQQRLDEINQAIREIAIEKEVVLIDIYDNQMSLQNPFLVLSSDGLHLSLEGNTVNANYIQQHINDLPQSGVIPTVKIPRKMVING